MSLQSSMRKFISEHIEASLVNSATGANDSGDVSGSKSNTTSALKGLLSLWQHESVANFLSYNFISSNFMQIMMDTCALQTELGMLYWCSG